MNSLSVFICVIVFGLVTVSEEANIARTTKKRRIMLNFGSDLVSGNAENPDLTNIQTSKNFNWKKMIKIKENFNYEVESNGQAFEK